MAWDRKYATATMVPMQLLLADGSFATDSDWTPAAGDVRIGISPDGLAWSNSDDIDTLPVYNPVKEVWLFAISSAETTGKLIHVKIIATEVKNDAFFIETYGHASAMYPDDFSVATEAVPTVGEIADAVWEEDLTDHSGVVGSTAEALEAATTGGGPSVADIVDGILDEILAGHTDAGSFGKAIIDLGTAVATIDDLLDTEIAALTAVFSSATTEPAAVPLSTATRAQKIDWIFAYFRNKMTNDGTNQKLYANDDSTVIGTQAVSNAGGTTTRAKAS